MPRFVFQLEAVLKQRLAAERERQLEVAALERERGALEEKIRAYQQELTQERHELHDQLAGASGGASLDLRGVRFQAGAALRIIANAQRSVLQLAGVHKKIDAARLLLLEATTKRKAVEVLKERRYEEWKAQQKRVEDAAADEINVMSASRGEGSI
jgi:flagellar export protein FliJ